MSAVIPLGSLIHNVVFSWLALSFLLVFGFQEIDKGVSKYGFLCLSCLGCVELVGSVSSCLSPHLEKFQPFHQVYVFSRSLSLLFFWNFHFLYVKLFDGLWCSGHWGCVHFSSICFSLFLTLDSFYWSNFRCPDSCHCPFAVHTKQ